MIGDIQNSIRWSEVNDCNSFQDGDIRKVTLYGKVVDDLEFDSEMEAEQRLYRYYRAQKKGSLLYENEYEEEKKYDPNKKIKVYFSGKTSDKDFGRFRKIVEHLLDYYHNPTLKEIEEEGKFVVFFHEGKAYLVRGEDVIIKDVIKLDNPKKYYPKDWKDGDPIPAETINRTIAEKLGISYEILKDHLGIEGNFTK